MTEDEKRQKWIAYSKTDYPRPPFPEVLRGLECGAKTRKGTACKLRLIYSSDRCKFHGGLSTGARTVDGKKKVAKTKLMKT